MHYEQAGRRALTRMQRAHDGLFVCDRYEIYVCLDCALVGGGEGFRRRDGGDNMSAPPTAQHARQRWVERE